MSSPALSTILPTPEAVACVRAIAADYGREAAVLLLQEFVDPEGIVESFAWGEGEVEGCETVETVGAGVMGKGAVETYRQGRMW